MINLKTLLDTTHKALYCHKWKTNFEYPVPKKAILFRYMLTNHEGLFDWLRTNPTTITFDIETAFGTSLTQADKTKEAIKNLEILSESFNAIEHHGKKAKPDNYWLIGQDFIKTAQTIFQQNTSETINFEVMQLFEDNIERFGDYNPEKQLVQYQSFFSALYAQVKTSTITQTQILNVIDELGFEKVEVNELHKKFSIYIKPI